MKGQNIEISVSCGNSTTFTPIQSYTVSKSDEEKEWLELSINKDSVSCSATEKHTFSAQVSNNAGTLSAILVIYDYSESGIRSLASSAVIEKRAVKHDVNKTLLSDYVARSVNCSVQSVFLNYAADLPLFPETVKIAYPNSIGLNMTFCFGLCNMETISTDFPPNLTNVKRHHFFNSAITKGDGFSKKACCTPKDIRYDNLMIYDEVAGLYLMESLPQVTACHCLV